MRYFGQRLSQMQSLSFETQSRMRILNFLVEIIRAEVARVESPGP